MHSILEQAFSSAKFAPETTSHALVFVFGDLNFRVSLKNEQCRDAIANKQLDYIKQYDELLCLRNSLDQKQSGHQAKLGFELQEAMNSKKLTAIF